MASKALYVLFEHAIGYSLFRVKEFYEVEQLKSEVEKSVLDLSRFNSIVKLEAFSSFKNAKNSLDNMNAISEGIIHEDLKEFIASNVPASTKKQQVVLGVSDTKLSATIKDELDVECLVSDSVREIVRGLRLHAPKLIRNLTDVMQGKAQASLALNYSRSKVKFNINREDNMVIQGIGCLDQKDKEINTMSMQLRNWYSDCFPELKHIVPDNRMYFQVMQYIGDRKTLTEDRLPGLEEIVMDSAKARAIYNAARSSIGMDVAQVDLINISNLASRLIKSIDGRKSLQDYLHSKMGQVAPNLSELIGDQVGARLISHAGSLTNLAKCAASTVQILGAEKALFRALKTRGNTPKYGLIFHASYISKASLKNKGRISRNLANKCSLASRIDCFTDIPTSVYGAHLKQLVEERLKFYESGETPRKNCDVMGIAAAEAAEVRKALLKREKKKKRKSVAEDGSEPKRIKMDAEAEQSLNKSVAAEDDAEGQKSHEKKKKKKKAEVTANDSITSLNDSMPVSCPEDGEMEGKKKKKKKRKSEGVTEESVVTLDQSLNVSGTEICATEEKKKKKKKGKANE